MINHPGQSFPTLADFMLRIYKLHYLSNKINQNATLMLLYEQKLLTFIQLTKLFYKQAFKNRIFLANNTIWQLSMAVFRSAA